MDRYHITTFGCQMNQHDSDRLREVLEAAGHSPAETREDARVVVFNTCSVREKAVQKLRSEVGRVTPLKKQRPDLILVVTGCLAQQEGEQLLRQIPQLDLVLGPDNLRELPSLLQSIDQGAPPRARTEFDLDQPEFLMARPRSGPVSTFVTTMKGCDERCTFCIVPRTRGPERYRASGEVLGEICGWVEQGAREITLLGQTVDSYRDPSGQLLTEAPAMVHPVRAAYTRAPGRAGDESQFPELLRAIAEAAPGLRRLRYTSPHPRHLTPRLIAAHRDLSVLAQHVHMPVQSGSNRVLKRMGRRYDVEEYVERTAGLQAAVPGLTLSTDIIVGFPGETCADFEATLELVRRVGFVGVFGFKYSERPLTPALKWQDDVPEQEKSTRLSALFALADQLRMAHFAGLVGTEQQVLIDEEREPGVYAGRTLRNEIVHVASSRALLGEIVQVTVTRSFKHSLAAELLDPTFRVKLPERRPAAASLRVVQ